MATVALIDGWVDPGFTHRIKQIQRFVRAMTFDASDRSVRDVKGCEMFLGVYLGKIARTGFELTVTVETSLKSVLFRHLSQFCGNEF